MIITEVATQGYNGKHIQEWTKGYHLGYSIGSGTHFFKEKNEDRAKVREKFLYMKERLIQI